MSKEKKGLRGLGEGLEARRIISSRLLSIKKEILGVIKRKGFEFRFLDENWFGFPYHIRGILYENRQPYE